MTVEDEADVAAALLPLVGAQDLAADADAQIGAGDKAHGSPVALLGRRIPAPCPRRGGMAGMGERMS